MIDKEINKDEQQCHYKLKQWVKRGRFEILNDISTKVNLFQLMNTLGNFNNVVIIAGIWIYDPNDEKKLPLVK